MFHVKHGAPGGHCDHDPGTDAPLRIRCGQGLLWEAARPTTDDRLTLVGGDPRRADRGMSQPANHGCQPGLHTEHQ